MKIKFDFRVVFFIVVLATAVVGKFYTPHDPNLVDMGNILLNPSMQHLLGTDYLGRDLFSRILSGAWTTVSTSLMILILSIMIGVTLGLIAGYIGGKTDWIIMRFIDSFVAFPDYIIAIVISGILGGGTTNLIIAIVCIKWIAYARVTRAQVKVEKSKDYIAMAKINGVSNFNILIKHLLPHVFEEIVAMATADMGKVVLIIASLSYIGLGVQPPNPEWGYILNEGRTYFATNPILMIAPGVAIVLVVLSTNLLGNYISEKIRDRK